MLDAVSKLTQHVANQQQETRVEVVAARARNAWKERIRWVHASLVALIFLVALVLAIPRWQHPFKPPTGAAAEHDARRAMVFAAQLVDQHIRAQGGPPASFDELGVKLPGVHYQRLDSSYVLSTIVEGRTLEYRRGEDPARFLAGQ